MKKYLLFLAIVSSSQFLNAQMQTNIWYFGTFAGLDFSSGSPVSLTNGQLNTAEGCATISDANGNLLFYSSGAIVYNKDHQIMPNGSGLNGQYSSSQSTLAAPMPGSDSIYYLFTTAEQAGPFGLQYSIVDMSLQGGLGDVTDKNIPLVEPVGEKLTAVQQTGTNNIWIVTHEYYTANFYSYLLTDTGLNTTPVVTNVGSIHSGFGTENAIGYMRISPDGKHITAAISRNLTFELFDFDASTGIPSNPLLLPVSDYTYGIEYSRNSKILYAAEFNNKIYQYNLDAGSPAEILASKTLVGQPSAIEIGALQMGPDGKIYVVKNGANNLGAIQEPDSLGLACDYSDNACSISPNTGIEGLPNFFVSFFNPNVPQTAFTASETAVCEKFCVSFHDSSTNNPTAWQWIFPGASPASSTDQNPSPICYDEPGVYDVTLITTIATGTDTLTLPDYITVFETPAFPIITQNGYTLTSSASDSYQWQQDAVDILGATNQSYDVMQTGFYTVVVSDANGCKNSTTEYILISGVDELNDASFNIFPNPTSGNFVIHLSDAISLHDVSLRIFNSLGQIIYTSNESLNSMSSEYAIQLGKVSPGIYLVELKTGNTLLHRKLTVVN